jgi:hypothetical protein
LIAAGLVFVLASAGCGGSAAKPLGSTHTHAPLAVPAATETTAPPTAASSGSMTGEAGSASVFSFDGFTLDIPTRWDSTTRFGGAAYLTAASSRVSPGEGALGIGSQRFMRPNDVLVSIVEYRHPRHPAGFRPLLRAPAIESSQVTFYEGTPHVMFVQAYRQHHRCFQVGVAFGRNHPTAAQIALANRVLGTLTVAADSPTR